ncbi:MAG: ADP-ribose pyrophosphatase [Kiritimatiellia bacterium]|jgi:ADP-ribose pyrophosphatase
MVTEQSLSKNDVEIVKRQVVYQGFFAIEKLQLRHRLFNGAWSAPLTRELFVRGTAVAAVLYDPTHQLIGLVEQFRVGLLDSESSPWCREVVAGMAEPGELDNEVMLRELQEEAGIVPQALHKICEYYSSPGGTSERLTLYCAMADLSEAGGFYGLPEEGEDIHMLVLAEDEVFSALYDGQYNNAATLICLQWLVMKKHTLSLTPNPTVIK